ncbi:MAG: hypothetical protein ACLRSE_10530 [Alistipes finegoldii]
MKRNRNNSLLDRALLRRSLRESFIKLDPRKMVRNPIMFTVEAVTFVMLALLIYIAVTGDASQGSLLYNFIVFVVLLATLLFANFAEAIAEARGRAQADSLRKTREETPAKRIEPDGQSHIVSVLGPPAGRPLRVRRRRHDRRRRRDRRGTRLDRRKRRHGRIGPGDPRGGR